MTGSWTTADANSNLYRYDPWGVRITNSGSPINPFKFTGAYHLTASGLFDFGARTYFPERGRFTQLDPLPASISDLNRHAYAGCNPTNFVDPTGLFSVDAAFSACVFGAFQNVAFAFGAALLTGGTVGVATAVLGCAEGVGLYALSDAGYPGLATTIEALSIFAGFRGLFGNLLSAIARSYP